MEIHKTVLQNVVMVAYKSVFERVVAYITGGSTWKWDCTIYGYNMEQIMLLQNSTGAFSGPFIRLLTFL